MKATKIWGAGFPKACMSLQSFWEFLHKRLWSRFRKASGNFQVLQKVNQDTSCRPNQEAFLLVSAGSALGGGGRVGKQGWEEPPAAVLRGNGGPSPPSGGGGWKAPARSGAGEAPPAAHRGQARGPRWATCALRGRRTGGRRGAEHRSPTPLLRRRRHACAGRPEEPGSCQNRRPRPGSIRCRCRHRPAAASGAQAPACAGPAAQRGSAGTARVRPPPPPRRARGRVGRPGPGPGREAAVWPRRYLPKSRRTSPTPSPSWRPPAWRAAVTAPAVIGRQGGRRPAAGPACRAARLRRAAGAAAGLPPPARPGLGAALKRAESLNRRRRYGLQVNFSRVIVHVSSPCPVRVAQSPAPWTRGGPCLGLLSACKLPGRFVPPGAWRRAWTSKDEPPVPLRLLQPPQVQRTSGGKFLATSRRSPEGAYSPEQGQGPAAGRAHLCLLSTTYFQTLWLLQTTSHGDEGFLSKEGSRCQYCVVVKKYVYLRWRC